MQMIAPLTRMALIIICILAIVACDELRTKIDPAALNHQKPFGYSWEVFDRPGELVGQSHWDRCRELILRLDVLIALEEQERFTAECAQDNYSTMFIANEVVPQAFQNGEMSVDLHGKAQPVQFVYTYLHRVLSDEKWINTFRRKEHAAAIRRSLTSLYGASTPAEQLFQFGQTAETQLSRLHASCEYWLLDDIAIELCEETVVLLDAIAMTLSFSRADHTQHGRLLQCALEPNTIDNCRVAQSGEAIESIDEGSKYLNLLADWVDPAQFQACDSGELEPLEEVWDLPQSEEADLSSALETYSGDELALFAINYKKNSEIDLPRKTLSKIRMYLFKKAAAQGSSVAMNEIGASLLYCYQSVSRNIVEAQYWLKKAVDGNDAYAMKSLALMYALKMTDSSNPMDKAIQFLQQCAELDASLCSDELVALNRLRSALN